MRAARTMERVSEQRRRVAERLGKIRRKIAVISGKGGVGKTTVAVNIAGVLAEKERTGLLDADIDCPNVNRFLGISGKFMVEGGRIRPVEKYGMKIASMASLQDADDTPIIWRGPMISHAILQFLEAVEWGELDYLIVDSPPGTSDALLTLMQMVRLDGVIVVSTPHSASIADAKKAVNMAKQMGTPVLGVVENMAGGIFGSGAAKIADDLHVSFLGSIGIDRDLYELTDRGLLPVKEKRELYILFRRIINNFSAGLGPKD